VRSSVLLSCAVLCCAALFCSVLCSALLCYAVPLPAGEGATLHPNLRAMPCLMVLLVQEMGLPLKPLLR